MRRALVAGFVVWAVVATGLVQAAPAPLQRARTLVEQKHYGPALAIYRALLEQAPGDADLLIETARVYGWNDENAQAAKLYERVLRVAPARRRDVLRSLAWQLLWSKQPDRAAGFFDEYLRAHPRALQVRLGLAEARAASGRTSAALQAYRAVLAGEPGNVRARLGVARMLVRGRHYAPALVEYRKLVAARPDDADLLIEVARVYGWNNENRRAAELYRRVLDVAPGRRRDVERPLAFQLLWSGQGVRAIPYFRDHLARNPADTKARLGFARALAAAGRSGPALVQYRHVLAVEPLSLAARLGIARMLVREGHYRESLTGYRILLKRRPDDADLLIEAARVYGWDNQNARSASLYERAIRVAPQRHGALILPLAWQLTWSGNAERAIALFREYLAAHPGEVSARVGLGEALTDAGRPEQALAQYRAVLAHRPHQRNAQYGAARVLGWMGRYGAAERIYREVLQRHPGDIAAQAGLARLENWGGRNRAAARTLSALLRAHAGRTGLRHDLATAQYWSGFDDLALTTLDGSRVQADVALRRHIRHELAPSVSASLDGSTDSDRLHIVGVTLNAQYRFGATRWLGLAYRVARLQQGNPAIRADNRLYGREVLVSGGQRIGSLDTPWGTVWPSLALGVRKYSNWQTFAWRANAKWIPTDLWRVDFYSGNEVIENIRSIRNRATFRSLDADVSWQALPRLNLGIGAGAGIFADLPGDRNIRRRFRSHVLGVFHLHPRIFAEWSFLYFNDSNPNVQVGYYNPGAYWEHRATFGFSTRWHGFALAARGGVGRLTEDPGSSDWLYFWQASIGRGLGNAGGLRLVVGRTDSKQLAGISSEGYRRTYLSLGYIYRF